MPARTGGQRPSAFGNRIHPPIGKVGKPKSFKAKGLNEGQSLKLNPNRGTGNVSHIGGQGHPLFNAFNNAPKNQSFTAINQSNHQLFKFTRGKR